MSDDDRDYYANPVLPTVWRGKDGMAFRTDSPVADPNDMSPEERRHIQDVYNTCGQCAYFELAHAQQQMKAQRFLERLVQEEDWQVKYLCSPVNELGICGAHDSGAGGEQCLTGKMHRACDQFRPDQGKLRVVK